MKVEYASISLKIGLKGAPEEHYEDVVEVGVHKVHSKQLPCQGSLKVRLKHVVLKL